MRCRRYSRLLHRAFSIEAASPPNAGDADIATPVLTLWRLVAGNTLKQALSKFLNDRIFVPAQVMHERLAGEALKVLTQFFFCKLE
jgi:hypothetical protein